MNSETLSLWKLLENYSIEIPMIQRDYAQGRDEGKVPFIRKNILRSIHNAMRENQSPLDFDFIYGKTENGKIIPIDGQQRLTTLFLLHWFFSVKEEILKNDYSRLLRFSYHTRNSSALFCEDLIKKGSYDRHNDMAIDDQIRDSSWFISSWEKDPTVSSMLNMLHSIEEEFENDNGPFFDRLTNSGTPQVFFHFNEMQKLKLTDDTYIKMNSRGKQLSDFEHFKSRFEQYLNDNDPFKPFHKKFVDNIDTTWTDFFWSFNGYKPFDAIYIRFSRYVMEVLHYSRFINDPQSYEPFSYNENDPDFFMHYFNNNDNIRFYLESLDTLCMLYKGCSFFNNVFSCNTYDFGKVCLFHKQNDLLRRCVDNDGFGIPEKALLYFCLLVLPRIQDGLLNIEECKKRIRLIRNLFQSIRQINWPVYSPNIRYEDVPFFLDDMKTLAMLDRPVDEYLQDKPKFKRLNTPYLQEEIYKAGLRLKIDNKEILNEIEDNLYFKGLIHNFTNKIESDEIKPLYALFKGLWIQDNTSLIIEALIAFGFLGVNVGGSGIGQRYFFGSKANWHTVLTSTSAEREKLDLVDFLRIISNKSANASSLTAVLKEMKENKLAAYTNAQKKDRNYYFLKYPEILDPDECQFAQRSTDSIFEIQRLITKTARGYHVNPFAYTVWMRAKKDVELQGKVKSIFYGIGYDDTPIVLDNGIIMTCCEKGWKVDTTSGCAIDIKLIQGVVSTDEENLLVVKDTQDSIEIALAFIKLFTNR